MDIKEVLKLTKQTTKIIVEKISPKNDVLFKKTLSSSIIFGGTLFSAGSYFCDISFIDAISNSMNALSGHDETSLHDFVISLLNPDTTAEKIRLTGSIIILSSPIPAMAAKIIDTIIDIKRMQDQLMEADMKNETIKIDTQKYARKDPVLSDFMNLWVKGYNAENNSGFFNLFDGNKKSINLASILLLKNSSPVDKDFFNQTIVKIREMKGNGEKLIDIINKKESGSKLKKIKELKVMYSISSSKETKKAIISSLSNILIKEKPDADIAKMIGFGTSAQEQKKIDNIKIM